MFGNLLTLHDWSPIYTLTTDEAATYLCDTLNEMTNACFPEKNVSVKSSDPPWVNYEVRKFSKKKKKSYKKKKGTPAWRTLTERAQLAVDNAKKNYLERVRSKVAESGNITSMFKAVKILQGKEAPKPWSVNQLYPGKEPGHIAEECVQYFSEISRTFEPLDKPVPSVVTRWKIEMLR